MNKYLRLIGLLFFCLTANTASAYHNGCDTALHADSILASGAAPRLISSQFSFTEGPAVDRQGNIFFTDQPNNKIWEYDINGKLSIFLDPAGRSNGTYFDREGNLIACADEHNQLWSISPKGKIKVLIDLYKGKHLNGPNDLWIDRRGGIYLTDPYYQRPYWQRQAPELAGEKVYYLPKGKKELLVVAADLVKPNGIVGTPDGQYLYVADIGANKTYKYHIERNGELSDKQLFTNQGSDGMTLDNHGNVYLCGNGVTVYNPAGQKILHIPIPAKWTANICFGGRDRSVLFITASESVYVLPTLVKGVE
ncbi:SMP-30/gluconolactonase/LRE family protein [Mucilaginibacter paludis]|uniref:SMP-30/Gluconolaconase/LRE-like region-containing protein n=1 Tax=Mucilaginibacter paludis DSM 18603 TaxID=714943 RepID=H1Y4H7_9SPHI|nr:SMP-30/gluconolactonase/LRE family protein [Mucilaginibacter paludis]EHQ26761.1 SMP-30/Gluconolaconase/LRE-like region-containing protein [Mucilaginibacter paludis DSM 18603]